MGAVSGRPLGTCQALGGQFEEVILSIRRGLVGLKGIDLDYRHDSYSTDIPNLQRSDERELPGNLTMFYVEDDLGAQSLRPD